MSQIAETSTSGIMDRQPTCELYTSLSNGGSAGFGGVLIEMPLAPTIPTRHVILEHLQMLRAGSQCTNEARASQGEAVALRSWVVNDAKGMDGTVKEAIVL